MIALPPCPLPQLRCCQASGCRSAGGDALLQALRQSASAHQGADGGSDGSVVLPPVTIKAVGCLRLCGRGPLVACDGPQGTRLYGGLQVDDAAALLSRCRQPVATQQPDAGDGLDRRRVDLEQPFFALQRPLVLEHCGLIDPESIEEALARGTYAQLRRCLHELSPAQVRAAVRRSGLRGRGGAGYPTGLKWDTVALQPAGPRFVVCNADEGDPGAFMNRSVLEGDPHRLLEGIAIAAYAIGADRGFVYVRAEYPLAIARIRRALEQARRRGLFGSGPAAGAFHLDLEVRVGAGAYVCGEETALLASIQGRRGCPKPRPPFPAQSGLWGAPTLINNVETLATIPVILRLGGEAYAAIGSPTSPGTKVFALSGAVRRTGLVEVPLGTTLRTIVETIGGGALGGVAIDGDESGGDASGGRRPAAASPDAGDHGDEALRPQDDEALTAPGGGALKAVQTGGPSGGCIPASHLDTAVDYESLRALGAMMGSGGLVVVDTDTPMPLLARHFMAFSVSESCGKCVPCRAGTVQLAELLDRFVAHQVEPADLDRLEELCAMVRDTSLCGLGQAAPSPVLSTLRWFRQEYEAGIGQSPAGAASAAGGHGAAAVVRPLSMTGTAAAASPAPDGAADQSGVREAGR